MHRNAHENPYDICKSRFSEICFVPFPAGKSSVSTSIESDCSVECDSRLMVVQERRNDEQTSCVLDALFVSVAMRPLVLLALDI